MVGYQVLRKARDRHPLAYRAEDGVQQDEAEDAQCEILTMRYNLYNEDCIEVMRNMPEGSIDLVCTDPPYLIPSVKWEDAEPTEVVLTLKK